MRSPIEMMVDVACTQGLMQEAFPDFSADTGVRMAWIVEGYTIDEAAEGILSNAGIVVAEPAPIKLTQWCLKDLGADPFKAPEVRPRGLCGFDGTKHRITSPIVEKLGPRTFKTLTGTVYELVGDPEPGYLAFCEGIGKPLNLEDPVKLITFPREDTP